MIRLLLQAALLSTIAFYAVKRADGWPAYLKNMLEGAPWAHEIVSKHVPFAEALLEKASESDKEAAAKEKQPNETVPGTPRKAFYGPPPKDCLGEKLIDPSTGQATCSSRK